MAPGHTVPGATNAISTVNNCITACAPSVAATGFFTGEVEIFDFVTERVKRRIAAKKGNEGRRFWGDVL